MHHPPPATSPLENGMHLFIYFYWVSPEIFLANLFDSVSCGICWWILKFSSLTDNHGWCITMSSTIELRSFYQHWIDNQTHWICSMFCHWKAHTHIMSCEQTNMLHRHSTLRHFSRDDNGNVSRYEDKEKENENNSKKVNVASIKALGWHEIYIFNFTVDVDAGWGWELLMSSK